jgi:hypothetical protein
MSRLRMGGKETQRDWRRPELFHFLSSPFRKPSRGCGLRTRAGTCVTRFVPVKGLFSTTLACATAVAS